MTLTVGILTGGSNNHQTTSEEANAVATDLISTGVTGPLTNTAGVAPATGSFAVNAQGSPDMTIAVSAGVAYVAGTPTSQNSQKMRVKNSATANVTIAANASGSTKYNWVYISLDATKMANPAVGADDVATLVTSRSSNASTDDGTPPTYGCLLAVVTVANGASSLANGTIADKRVPASYRSSPATNGVNHIDIASATTGNGPQVSATGTDTNIDLKLTPKGTGRVVIAGAGVAGRTQRNTSSTTASTSFTSTLGDGFTDSVTVTVGTSGMALISIYGILSNSGNNFTALAYAVSGATTKASSDFRSVGSTVSNVLQVGATFLETDLTAGSTTFTMQYRVGAGTGTFNGRSIVVIPL